VKISDERMSYLEKRVIARHGARGEWNYAALPAPRPAPEPEPEPQPAGPDPVLLQALAALAGIPAPDTLLTEVSLAWTAGREHRLTLSRGHERLRARKASSTYPKLSPQAILTAAACRIRLGMTWALLGRLLGVHPSTICVPASHAIPVLARHGITAQPGSPRITTPASLRDHAAAAGITLTIPEPAQEPAKPAPQAAQDHDTPNLKTDASVRGASAHDRGHC
jgi:hypothetical protein